MDNTETFHNKSMVVAESVGFRFEADPFKSVPMILGLAVMDNIETFQSQKTVAAENVGFRGEADLFKSVPMFLGFGYHGQH